MGKNTKERLLLAAASEFANHGYQAAIVRTIVERAGAKNLNAVVYYFGSKEGLYKAVLEFMFFEAEKFKEQHSEEAWPAMNVEDRIVSVIKFLCRAYYSVDTPVDRDFYRIFIREASNPTPFFTEMVKSHLRPAKEYLCSLLKEYFGPDVDESVIEDCEYSISAQILYGALGWEVISRINPEKAPFAKSIEHLSEHIASFSLAGLQAFKAQT